MTTAPDTTIAAFADKLIALQQTRFSGRLLLKNQLGLEWSFYLYLGRILYADGGVHPVRRWQRNLANSCLRIPKDAFTLNQSLGHTPWEYELLSQWIKQQNINREQAVKLIQCTVDEILFDVFQLENIIFQAESEKPLSLRIVLIDTQQALATTEKLWQTWQIAKISNISPNKAPIIKQLEQLQKRTSTTVYQSLVKLLNGKQTLRDIALKTNQNVTEITRSLLPYLKAKLIGLIDIDDLPRPILVNNSQTSQAKLAYSKILIACVDDSTLMCQTMENILTSVGYQFLAIQDSMRAVTTLLTRKPNLIFLDLVMPHTNGYEICSQLRKISAFHDTPIIILTGNEGLIDRFRGKIVGASEFLIKPIDGETVLKVTKKYLKQSVNSSVEK